MIRLTKKYLLNNHIFWVLLEKKLFEKNWKSKTLNLIKKLGQYQKLWASFFNP